MLYRRSPRYSDGPQFREIDCAVCNETVPAAVCDGEERCPRCVGLWRCGECRVVVDATDTIGSCCTACANKTQRAAS